MKKKIFAVLTAVFMVMALIPTLASAAGVKLEVTVEGVEGKDNIYIWYGSEQYVKVENGSVTIEDYESSWGFLAVALNNAPTSTADFWKVNPGDSEDTNVICKTADVKTNNADAVDGVLKATAKLEFPVEEPATSDEEPATSDESPATSEEESSETPAESSEISVESSDPTPASSDPTTPPTTSNPASGVQGLTIAVVAATVAGVVVSAKKSKK